MHTPPEPDCSPVPVSLVAKRTCNPIRGIVDRLAVEPNPSKDLISLALGDPTVFGNLNTHPAVIDAVREALDSSKANGYPPAIGYDATREAIAKRYSTKEYTLTKQDVIVASGCSGALELAIGVLASEGDSILIPQPGFSLYSVLARSKGINIINYPLIPEKLWEIDLEQVERILSTTTCSAWIINNPSNPCGSVFTKAHLEACLKVAKKYSVPIIADEIYEYMVFSGHEFFPIASLHPQVPILTCGGLAKRFLVPGWRLGWILLHNIDDKLSSVRDGLVSLSGLILGANSLIQYALPSIFDKVPTEFFSTTNAYLESSADRAFTTLTDAPGLTPIRPQGTMYLMVQIDISRFPNFPSDIEFLEKLMAEESVLCLPGSIFGIPNYFRIVFSGHPEKIREATLRISEFCKRHVALK